MSKALSYVLFFLLLSFSAAALEQLMSFQGDVLQAGAPVNNGNLSTSIYDAIVGGNLIYTDNFTSVINSGRFDVLLGNGSAANDLILNFSQMYYITFSVNGNVIPATRQTFMNGLARGFFVDSTNRRVGIRTTTPRVELEVNGTINATDILMNGTKVGVGTGLFYNLTPATYDGNVSGGGFLGYKAANYICDANFTGSHWCSTDEILVTIAQRNISSHPYWAGYGWIAEGPPGFTANANDCIGMKNNSNLVLGAFWIFNQTTGGEGWLTPCNIAYQLACCK